MTPPRQPKGSSSLRFADPTTAGHYNPSPSDDGPSYNRGFDDGIEQGRAQERIDPDDLGRALHKARSVGGPWHPCGPWEYGYDSGTGSYECECGSMARHLLAILDAGEEQ